MPAALDPRTQASLSRGSAQGPWLPEFLGCLGPPLRLRRRWDCTAAELPIHAVSLAEGRGERTFLRVLHLEV